MQVIMVLWRSDLQYVSLVVNIIHSYAIDNIVNQTATVIYIPIITIMGYHYDLW